MQIKYGYPVEPPEVVLKYMNVATNQIGQRFDCSAVTLEMPFKDCLSKSDPNLGWTPARSRLLGVNVLGAIDYVQPYSRTTEPNFWETPPLKTHLFPRLMNIKMNFPSSKMVSRC